MDRDLWELKRSDSLLFISFYYSHTRFTSADWVNVPPLQGPLQEHPDSRIRSCLFTCVLFSLSDLQLRWDIFRIAYSYIRLAVNYDRFQMLKTFSFILPRSKLLNILTRLSININSYWHILHIAAAVLIGLMHFK